MKELIVISAYCPTIEKKQTLTIKYLLCFVSLFQIIIIIIVNMKN